MKPRKAESVMGSELRLRRLRQQPTVPTNGCGGRADFGEKILDAFTGFAAYWDSDVRCRYANPTYLEWFGRTREESVGLSMQDLLGEAVFAHTEPHVRAALRGERPQFERTLTKSTGEIRHFLIIFIPDIVEGKVVGFISQTSDVTLLKTAETSRRAEVAERDRMQKHLAETALALAKAQKLGQIGSWELLPAGDVVSWSDELYAIFGFDPSGPAPSLADQESLYAPESWSRILEAISKALKEGEPYRLEIQYFSRDGRNGWLEARGEAAFDEFGKVVKIHGTAQDITRRKRDENARRESEARFRMIAEATSDVITQLDLDLVRQYASPGCRAVLGYDPEEMIGASATAIEHPEDARMVRSTLALLAAGATHGDKTSLTNRVLHKRGHWVWIETGISLLRDPETGAPNSLICSMRDVTERQRAAQHLERAKLAAEHAARIKADFLANMSHELRTPLAGILGIHDLLRLDPTLGPQAIQYVDMARDSGRSLLTIINDVLDFSKIEAGKLSIEKLPFPLAQTIEACRALASAEAARKSLTVIAEIEGASVTLVGDENRIRQILLNLLMNAVKFSERGQITISGRYSAQKGRLRIEVVDTGIGIAADKLSRLFERFNQADSSTTRRYGGTGLGLAICKKLVEMMGGLIGAESQLGRGSTFWFELPLPIAEAEATQPEMTRAIWKSRRVLLAEDNVVNQRIIKAMIENAGHLVTIVDTGVTAVTAARSGKFDVILMDVQMPKMDGLTATRLIRATEKEERRRATPIVGLTANAMHEDVLQVREAGMDAHVAKPIEWTELFTTIDRVVLEAPETPVLDEGILSELAGVMGRARLANIMACFIVDLQNRMATLGVFTTSAELANTVHALVGASAQLGFLRLSHICEDVEIEARQGAGLNRIPDLLAAAEDVAAVGESSSYFQAAPLKSTERRKAVRRVSLN